MHEPAERFGVNDPVAVPLKFRPVLTGDIRVLPASGVAG